MEDDLKKKIDIREEVPVNSFSIAAFICRKAGYRGEYRLIRVYP